MSIDEKLIAVAENQEKVFEAGKSAEWNAFWDEYQSNGTRSDYANAFQSAGWGDITFKPKYNIAPNGSMYQCFYNCKLTNLKKITEECGIVIDTSNSSNVSYLFALSTITNCPTIRLKSDVKTDYLFYRCTKLHTIEKIVVSEQNTFNKGFDSCSELENITFEGTIGKSIDFSDSPLTPESMINVITHLARYENTENEDKYTVSFSESCWQALENSDYNVNDYFPDVVSWADACGYVGWNI